MQPDVEVSGHLYVRLHRLFKISNWNPIDWRAGLGIERRDRRNTPAGAHIWVPEPCGSATRRRPSQDCWLGRLRVEKAKATRPSPSLLLILMRNFLIKIYLTVSGAFHYGSTLHENIFIFSGFSSQVPLSVEFFLNPVLCVAQVRQVSRQGWKYEPPVLCVNFSRFVKSLDTQG